jgi:hypothetical protein
MKFFRGGMSTIVIDTERALKNSFSDSLFEFIKDNKDTFNDKQLLRAISTVSKGLNQKDIKYDTKVTRKVIQ